MLIERVVFSEERTPVFMILQHCERQTVMKFYRPNSILGWLSCKLWIMAELVCSLSTPLSESFFAQHTLCLSVWVTKHFKATKVATALLRSKHTYVWKQICLLSKHTKAGKAVCTPLGACDLPNYLWILGVPGYKEGFFFLTKLSYLIQVTISPTKQLW